MLRSSFVTHNESLALSADLKESIAASMRHNRSTVSEQSHCAAKSFPLEDQPYLCLPMSPSIITLIHGPCLLQALKDYDRRTRMDRSQKAHKHAEGLLQKALSSSGGGSHEEGNTLSQGDGGREVPQLDDAMQHQQSLPLPTTRQEPAEAGGATQHQQSLQLPTTRLEPAEAGGVTQHQHQQSLQLPTTRLEPPEVGENVAVVKADSTVTSPHIWVGRCLKVDGDHIIVAPFQEVGQNLYVFRVGKGREKVLVRDIVSPIDFVHCSTDNTYRLRTSKTEIHLCWSPLL